MGGSADPPTRYEVHGSSLTAVQEPGFVVRGFLWCASKTQPQLDPELKEVHKLDGGKWPDQETRAIVSASVCVWPCVSQECKNLLGNP